MRRKNWLVHEAGFLVLVLFLGLALLGTGCATGPIRSQVLDAQTRQPVPGAIVLGVWTKRVGYPGLASGQLVGVKEVEVDDQGRFTLERPEASFGEESVTVYKFGYVAWNNEEVFPSFERRQETKVPGQILLETFPKGGDHERHMRFIRDATISGLSARSWVKFREGIDREDRMR